MIAQIIDILEITSIAVCSFLMKKYVFLEPDMEPDKQRRFYGIGFLFIIVIFLVFGKDKADAAVLFLIGLNICLSRKKHRILGVLLMIPILGIINGLLPQIMLVPPFLFSMGIRETRIYQLVIYIALAILLSLFFVMGRAWRKSFNESMKHRSLRRSEILLLCMLTVFADAYPMLVFADESTYAVASSYSSEVKSIFGLGSMAVVVMTVTIIALIMQGNRRYFYFEQIAKMQSGMISFMAEVVENRDDNTGGHIRRTAKYVEGIAAELKRRGRHGDILTDTYVRNMVVAAPLHDIGKIHIPDDVLNKKGKLTNEEFEIMKTHTTAGEMLLRHAKEELGESEYLSMAAEMAAYHHEWWNGNGYPYGKAGEEIPLNARIMAVADVFDALTSKRCYKDAMPLEKAYSIIREETGTHFDPDVAEAFFAATQNIEET